MVGQKSTKQYTTSLKNHNQTNVNYYTTVSKHKRHYEIYTVSTKNSLSPRIKTRKVRLHIDLSFTLSDCFLIQFSYPSLVVKKVWKKKLLNVTKTLTNYIHTIMNLLIIFINICLKASFWSIYSLHSQHYNEEIRGSHKYFEFVNWPYIL